MMNKYTGKADPELRAKIMIEKIKDKIKEFKYRKYDNIVYSIFNNTHVFKDHEVLDGLHPFDYYIHEYKIAINLFDEDTPVLGYLEEIALKNIGVRYLIIHQTSTKEVRHQIIEFINRFAIKASTDQMPLLTPRYDGDAGWDMITSEDTIIAPGEYADVPSNLFMDMPDHLYGIVQARSSSSKKKILVLPGVIDPTYRGQVFAMVLNLSDTPVTIKRGDRVAQMLFLPRVLGLAMTETQQLRPSARAEKGFGSSGT